MRDPFPYPCPAFLRDLVTPLADRLHLPTLPLHIHEVLLALAFYQFIGSTVSPRLSTLLCPRTYPYLNKRTRINWDVHVVSLFQSTIISVFALYLIWYDEERKEMDWQQRIWGYDGASGLMQALAEGYFVWDLAVTARHVEIFGWGMLAHATAATTVFTLGFRPFVNYYGPVFILYELSSPFNNFHWFLDKLQLTGSMYQWINGIVLIVTFFSCRLLWGGINSYFVWADAWRALRAGHVVGSDGADLGLKLGLDQGARTADVVGADSAEGIMQFAGNKTLPLWLAASYMASNIVLNALNYYWMGKMIETIRKRFDPPWGTKGVEEKTESKEDGAKPAEIGLQRGVYEDGRKTVEVEGTELRSRRRG